MQCKAKTIWKKKMTDAANRKLASTAILNIDLQEKFITPQRSMQEYSVTWHLKLT